ncbi:MAG: 4-(cytidine 5'-diphospho)-2-C-methyl-D-erythritol kinase [Candidatus Wildermuthbacteria bacterium]|nr:4-(cytidine 5'-diphospho)-2-C-methyl-D-erythritol kinase [Candidatus Wildermuthbacteria bacterium]
MESILIQANAKINLDLKIVGKKPDGYHLIDGLFQSIDLADFLLFEKSKKNQFSGAIICPDSQNIILKAQRILEEKTDKKLPCEIHLQKSIPVSAGLGGGSADAAATLVAFNRLYGLGLPKKELVKIGLKIGADVPFFLYGGTCGVKGIGEKITPLKIKLPKFLLLFRPHKRLETKMMYELYDKTGKDFFSLAKGLCPDINKIEEHFAKFKIKLKLSGSGPTVFGEIDNYELIKKIIEGYQGFNGDVFICRPQDRALNIIWKT